MAARIQDVGPTIVYTPGAGHQHLVEYEYSYPYRNCIKSLLLTGRNTPVSSSFMVFSVTLRTHGQLGRPEILKDKVASQITPPLRRVKS